MTSRIDLLPHELQKHIYSYRIQPIFSEGLQERKEKRICKSNSNKLKKKELVKCLIRFYFKHFNKKSFIGGLEFLSFFKNNIESLQNIELGITQKKILKILNKVCKFNLDYTFLYENNILYEEDNNLTEDLIELIENVTDIYVSTKFYKNLSKKDLDDIFNILNKDILKHFYDLLNN